MRTKRDPVVIVGSGLAGLSAAFALSQRGVPVVVLEAHPKHFGGRTMGLDPVRFEDDGEPYEFPLDHGQHCVWTQYHNMHELLALTGIADQLVPCAGTQFVIDDGSEILRTPRFDTDPRFPHPTFVHFMAHLMGSTGFSRLSRSEMWQMARAFPRLATAAAFSHGRDYERWDRISIATYFAWAGLPLPMQAVSNALQKASTFHSADEMSAAWGLSMLESTMLGGANDHKMWCFRSSLDRALIAPLVAHLRARGVQFFLNATACGVEMDGDRVSAIKLKPNGNDYASVASSNKDMHQPRISCSAVISACDIPGFRQFLLRDLAHLEEIRGTARLETVSNVTVRAFVRTRLPENDPWLGIFVGPRFRILDDYFVLTRYQDDFGAWRARGGEVIELHSYLASSEIDPKHVPMPVIRQLIEQELLIAWPELRDQIAHLHVHANPKTFDKQSVGASEFQPSRQTRAKGLYLCGSWIKTDTAVHDMEKAVTTGLQAANAVLDERGEHPLPVRTNRPPSLLQRAMHMARQMLPTPPGVR